MTTSARWITLAFLLLLAAFAPAQPVGVAPVANVSATLEPANPAPGTDAVATITVEIPPAHHAQSHKPLSNTLIPFEVKVTGDGVTAGEAAYPKATIKNYPQLGRSSVYSGTITTTVPVRIDRAGATAQVSVTYQICNERGMCFQPKTETLALLGEGPANPPSPTVAAAPTQQVGLFGYNVSLTSVWITIPVAMVVGLLFNIMPCVLPVLPLKAMGFYEASQHDRKRTILLGTAFSLGLIGVFVALSLFVILSKAILGVQFQWGQWFAIGWFVWLMSIALVLLGIGMLGAFAVRLPNAFYALEFRHDTVGGNVKWGMLTALLSTPCTAPMFAGLVTWAIGQNVVIGAIVMIMVGVGMALPYLILSAFPEMARRFPRTGPASELVKQAMAIPLFATAAWLVGPRIVGDPAHYWLVYAVLALGGAYIVYRAATMLKPRGIAITCTVWALVLGACLWLTMALASKIDWQPYSDDALAQARTTGQPVIVKFTASWCANCQYIEQTVYHNEKTLAQLRDRHVKLIKADLTTDDAPGWKQLNALGQPGIPLTAIYLPGAEKPVLFDSIYSEHDLFEALGRSNAQAMAK